MADGKRREEWPHTSALMALLANCNRDPKRKSEPYTPKDFDPFAERAPKQRIGIEKLAGLMELKRD